MNSCPVCNDVVSPKALTCPHCGHPLRSGRPTRPLTKLLAWVLGIGLLVAIITTCNAPEKPQTKINPVDNLGTACQEFVRPRLNDPDSAQFGNARDASVEQDKKSPNVYTVQFDGRAKNGFGGLMLTTFQCRIEITSQGDYRLLETKQLGR